MSACSWMLLAIWAGMAAACGRPEPRSGGATTPGADAPTSPAAPWLSDQTETTGLAFLHVNGASGRYYYPEILGPGVALVDVDNDGDLDVYLVQGGVLGTPLAADVWIPPGEAPLRGRLFRNDLVAGRPETLRFVDVTAESALDVRGYGLGVAAGDVDNDGWTDLYVTRFGSAQLWRNSGGGRFVDVTATAGVANVPGFGVSASFVDYDRDGWLDLYVGNNVDYRLEAERPCPGPSGARDYCPPQIYGGTPDRLFRNRGHGRFEDVTTRVLRGGKFGPALGVVAFDANADGWTDIYVANDGEPNLLWINQQDGTFREGALPSGVALTADGKAESSMGVDADDFDNDGDDDLVVTELTGEGANLYRNEGEGAFRDVGTLSGLGAATMRYTGWGTRWVDLDNDGWLDVFAVNGPILATGSRVGSTFPYGQPPLLLRNGGTGRLETVSNPGPAFTRAEAGRGAAFGDLDNDGDVDVVVGNDAGPTRVLVNAVGTRRHWIGLRVVGTAGQRDMVGARVAVALGAGTTRQRRAHSDGSYASSSDPRVLVGLDDHVGPVAVDVQWPDGRRERWPSLPADRWHTLVQGTAP